MKTYRILTFRRTDAFGFSGAVTFAFAVKLTLLVLAAICEQIDDN